MEKNKFCIRPFNSIRVDTDGSMSTCCRINSKHSEFKGKHNYNLRTNSIKDFWQSDYRKTLAQAFLNSEQSKECQTCWDEEKRGIKSFRQFSNNEYGILGNKKPSEYLTLLKKQNLSHPEDYNLEITNLCNLKCYMCKGGSSSKLLVENNDLQLADSDGIRNKKQEDYDVDDVRLDYLIDQIVEENVTSITLQGGEPLLNPKIIKMLQKLGEGDTAKKVKVLITTNATQYSERILNILRKFEKIHIIFSIDGVGKVNDYLRYPSDFHQIKSNVKNYKTLGNATFMITCTVQNINLLYVKDMIEFAWQNGIHLKLGILDIPSYLHLSVLPTITKKKALQKLLDVDKNQLTHVSNFEVLKSLLESDIDREQVDEIGIFKSIISKRDSYRKINMADFVPQLATDLERCNT